MNSTFSASLQSPPSLLAIFRAQLFALIRGTRKESLIFLVLIVLPTAFQLVNVLPENTAETSLFQLLPYNLLILAALIFPFGVWRSEEPARRAYHWSMPVSRHAHSILKTFTGWFWLLSAIAVCALFTVLANMLLPLSESGPAGFLIPGPASQWVMLFTGPSIVYLLMSALVIVSGHPWRWIGGSVILYLTALTTLAALKYFQAAHFVSDLMFGRYGLITVLRGTSLAIGENPKVGVTYTLKLDSNSIGLAPSVAAAILWIAISLLAVCGVAYWRSRVPPRSE